MIVSVRHATGCESLLRASEKTSPRSIDGPILKNKAKKKVKTTNLSLVLSHQKRVHLWCTIHRRKKKPPVGVIYWFATNKKKKIRTQQRKSPSLNEVLSNEKCWKKNAKQKKKKKKMIKRNAKLRGLLFSFCSIDDHLPEDRCCALSPEG